MSRFYNPGFKWTERKSFDNPVQEPNSSNLSYVFIVAPEGEFFEVPDTQTVNVNGEPFEVPLRIREYIRTQYVASGVVLISPGRECLEGENIAPSDQEAKRKGDARWKTYTIDKCNEWIRICRENSAAGAIPRPAEGLFAHCLKARGIADPADVATGLSRAQEGQQENKELQAQLADALARINRLEGAKSVNKGA